MFRVYWGYMGIMEKKMETTIMKYIGGLGVSQNWGLYRGYIGIYRDIWGYIRIYRV